MRVKSIEELPEQHRAQAAAAIKGQPAATFRVEHTAGSTPAPKASKYRNRKVEFDGEKYDSELELEMCQSFHARWIGNPKPMAFEKDIRWYNRQVPFRLEGGVVYKADAQIVLTHEPWIEVWDAKGFFLQESKNKLKQMLDRYGIEVKLWRRLLNT